MLPRGGSLCNLAIDRIILSVILAQYLNNAWCVSCRVGRKGNDLGKIGLALISVTYISEVTGHWSQSVAFHKSTIVPVAAAADKGHCDAFVSILRPLNLTRTIKRIGD